MQVVLARQAGTDAGVAIKTVYKYETQLERGQQWPREVEVAQRRLVGDLDHPCLNDFLDVRDLGRRLYFVMPVYALTLADLVIGYKVATGIGLPEAVVRYALAGMALVNTVLGLRCCRCGKLQTALPLVTQVPHGPAVSSAVVPARVRHRPQV